MNKLWIYLKPLHELGKEDYYLSSGGIRGGDIGYAYGKRYGDVLPPSFSHIQFIFPGEIDRYPRFANINWGWYGIESEVVPFLITRI
jgi:hypothetical protein